MNEPDGPIFGPDVPEDIQKKILDHIAKQQMHGEADNAAIAGLLLDSDKQTTLALSVLLNRLAAQPHMAAHYFGYTIAAGHMKFGLCPNCGGEHDTPLVKTSDSVNEGPINRPESETVFDLFGNPPAQPLPGEQMLFESSPEQQHNVDLPKPPPGFRMVTGEELFKVLGIDPQIPPPPKPTTRQRIVSTLVDWIITHGYKKPE